MARLAIAKENSDDELPELSTVFATKENEGRPGRSRRVTPAEKKVAPRKKVERENEEDRDVVAGEKAKAKPRKRVLGRTTTNPLLRPLATTKTGQTTTASELSTRNANTKPISITKSITPPESSMTINSITEHIMTPKPHKTRATSKPIPKPVPVDLDSESDDMSDFIVSDTSCFTIDDCDEGEKTETEEERVKTPPRSVRRLVRGVRPVREITPEETDGDEGLGEKLGRLDLGDEEETSRLPNGTQKVYSEDEVKKIRNTQARPRSKEIKEAKERSKQDPLPKKKVESVKSHTEDPFALRFSPVQNKPFRDKIPKKKPQSSSSEMDDPFTLQYSPSENKPSKSPRKTSFSTPPGSPILKPQGLLSPVKRPPKIPESPHKHNTDDFWSQDIVNDWNDEYSPQKPTLPAPKLNLKDDSSSSLLFSPSKKSPAKLDKAVKDAKKAFNDRKHGIAEAFLKELDTTITSNQIASLSATTGGVQIIWSNHLSTTAGRANWKRETIRSPSNPSPIFRHHCSIELASKVIDCEDRLLNVLAHEFCHLANFMISNIKNNPHGKEFKAWAAKCTKAFGGRGIEVTTKHSYVIDYKYVWGCGECAVEYKRHSKSIDPKRHRCGKCRGVLKQVKPVPKNTGERGMTEYQAFVKENMRVVKGENPGSPQKEIMGLVGKRFRELKASKLGKENTDSTGSKEGTPEVEDELSGVVRKLDFLDLTSPGETV